MRLFPYDRRRAEILVDEMKHSKALILLVLPLLACSTDNESTPLGVDLIGNRLWSTPLIDATTEITPDTYFEASVETGRQDELLLGERRKFRFTSAVRYGDIPYEPDSIDAARLLVSPTLIEGAGDLVIGRIIEDWNEGTSAGSLDVSSGEIEHTLIGNDSIPLNLEWVRAWVDSGASNHGLLLSLAEQEGNFVRIPAREDPDTLAPRIRLELAVRDTAGPDTVYIDPTEDRFDAFKDPAATDYAVDNEQADTLLIGMRESMTNQALFQFRIPEDLRHATVNRADLVFQVAGERLDEEDEITLDVHVVLNETIDTDSIVIEGVLSAQGTFTGETIGDSLSISFTNVTRRWFAEQTWEPRVLIRASQSAVRRRYVSLYSAEAADSLQQPKLRILYTPVRPAGS